MLTGAQIRAALGLLGWDRTVLSERSGVSYSTIVRAVMQDGIPAMRADNLFAVQRALEEGGVVLIDDDQASPSGGQGVRLRRP